jgi:hypothetical protein
MFLPGLFYHPGTQKGYPAAVETHHQEKEMSSLGATNEEVITSLREDLAFASKRFRKVCKEKADHERCKQDLLRLLREWSGTGTADCHCWNTDLRKRTNAALEAK